VSSAPVVEPAASTGAASSTSSAPVAEPTATGEPSTASPAPAGDATPPSAGSETPAASAEPTPATGSDAPPADAPPAPATDSDNTPPASADSAEPTVDGTTDVPARRDVKPASQPLARRLAMSGSSMASAVRRQINSQ
jgi:hypothetical protein